MKNKNQVRMMRRDRTLKEDEVLVDCEYFRHPYLNIRDLQDIFIRSLILHTRKPDVVLYEEAQKSQRARISINDLTKKEIESVKRFVSMLMQ